MRTTRRVALTATFVACLLAVSLVPAATAATSADTSVGGADTPATLHDIDRTGPLAELVARCDLSATDIAPGESVTLDASASQDADAYRYDRFGTGEFGDFVERATRTVTYQEVGTYEPQVRVINATTDTTEQAVCGTLTVAENQPPTVDFSYSPTEPAPEEAVSFSADAADPDGEVVEYVWRIDGEPVAEGPTFEYAFPGPGDYTVELTATDDDGAQSTTERVVTVAESNQAPAVDFSYSPTEPAPEEAVSFSAEASDADGEVVEYVWRIDGEPVAEGPTFEYAFPGPGDYTVELTVTDDDGAQSTTERVVTVTEGNQGPTAGFSYSPTDPVPGETVSFSADASDTDGTVTEYDWRVNGERVSVYPDFQYAFDGAGEYAVELTVTDDDGATDTASRTVTVSDSGGNEPPTASFSVTPEQPTVGQETTFVADAADPDGEVVEYSWQIDGQYVSGGSEFPVSFTEPAEHVVRLTVTDDDGATASTSRTVTVAESSDNQPPTAGFDLDPSTPAPGETVTLAATASDSDGEVTAYQWRVDGSVVAERPTVEYAFPGPGDYTVALTVTDDDGETASASREVTVEGDEQPTTATPTPQPTATPTPAGNLTLSAAWWHSPTAPLRGEPVTLVASGPTDPAVTYQWDVDDDGSYEAQGALVSHVFTTAGDHSVTLQATLSDGSTETTAETVAVADETVSQPGAGDTMLWHAPVDPRPGETVTLVADVPADATVAGYRWDVDDDGQPDANGEVVAHTYPTEGRYTVSLTVEYGNGSTTTGTDTVVVGDAPEATATATATQTTTTTGTTTDGDTTSETPGAGTTGGGSPGFGFTAALAAFAVLAARLAGGRRGEH